MKIGIFSHYYHSTNYGGNLQAYALCKVLKDMGYEAEQVCYRRIYKKKVLKKGMMSALVRRAYRFLTFPQTCMIRKQIMQRNTAILKFNEEMIPHSKKVFIDSELHELNNQYDAFITGSDQVWHPSVLCPGFLLEFVAENKKRISYAASIASTNLDHATITRLKCALNCFHTISVREKDSVELLKANGVPSVEWALDPTLLLDAHDWREISKEYPIKGKYVLTYFLGTSKLSRKYAKRFAKENGLLLVNLPHLLGYYRICDSKYGDMMLYNVSPAQLIYLIDRAECVFTDSFHASVFSIILKTNFYVFKRSSKDSMTNRIISLLELFGLNEHFIGDHEDYCFLQNTKELNNEKSLDIYLNEKTRSMQFLLDSIGVD